MPRVIRAYVRYVTAFNRVVGKITMLGVFGMMGVLLYAAFMKAVYVPPIWSIEVAQFIMAAYYLLGGPYSMQLKGHVRMDLLYGRWSPRTKARVDAVTDLFLIFYLVVLLIGGISSTEYAIKYNETFYSSWAPRMAPIKILMTFGIFLMLLQAIAQFFSDIAAARGETLE